MCVFIFTLIIRDCRRRFLSHSSFHLRDILSNFILYYKIYCNILEISKHHRKTNKGNGQRSGETMRRVGVLIVLIVRIFATRRRTWSGSTSFDTRKSNARNAGFACLALSTFFSIAPDCSDGMGAR